MEEGTDGDHSPCWTASGDCRRGYHRGRVSDCRWRRCGVVVAFGSVGEEECAGCAWPPWPAWPAWPAWAAWPAGPAGPAGVTTVWSESAYPASLVPAPSGEVAHLTFTSPAAGFVVVTANFAT